MDQSKKMNFPYRLILASKSPRRKALLESLGLDFEVESNEVDESFDESLDPNGVAEFLAKKKSYGFRELSNDELLISSDTTVILNGKVLGKPADKKEAIQMITSLSNNTHQVVSGVCLRTREKEVSFSVSTTVSFDSIESSEIEHYIDQYKPFDKAGAYGIQEWIGMIGIKSIEGDYYNVVGLPVNNLYQTLKREFSV